MKMLFALRIVWRIAINAAYLFAVVLVFDQIDDRNTEILLAAIALTYVSVRSQAIVQTQSLMRFGQALDERLNTLQKAVAPDSPLPNAEVERKAVMRIGVLQTIEALGLGIVGLFALAILFL